MSIKKQGMVGVSEKVGGDIRTSLTWLVNMDFKGILPSGTLSRRLKAATPLPSLLSISTLLYFLLTSSQHW